MSKIRSKSYLSVAALVLISFSLSAGISARAEDKSPQLEKNSGSPTKEFKAEQPNFTNGREQTIESGMEPVIVQPSRADNGALVQPGKAALYSGSADLTNIIYRLGAPVMTGPINIYEVWYGSWLPTSTSTPTPKSYQTFTNDFLTAAAAPNQHWSINKLNYQAASATPSVRTYVGDYSTTIRQTVVPTNTTKYKSPLSQTSIFNIAKDTYFSAAGAKADPNGIYVVLTSSDIRVSGFGTSFCGWHSYNATSLAKYSFVGDPASTPGCLAQTVGPNLAGADAMLSVLMHELEETATDPQLNAWYSANGNENGDKCAWTWGATTLNSNGSYSNMTLGSKNYLIQQNFKLTGTAPAASTATTHTWAGTCAIK